MDHQPLAEPSWRRALSGSLGKPFRNQSCKFGAGSAKDRRLPPPVSTGSGSKGLSQSWSAVNEHEPPQHVEGRDTPGGRRRLYSRHAESDRRWVIAVRLCRRGADAPRAQARSATPTRVKTGATRPARAAGPTGAKASTQARAAPSSCSSRGYGNYRDRFAGHDASRRACRGRRRV